MDKKEQEEIIKNYEDIVNKLKRNEISNKKIEKIIEKI